MNIMTDLETIAEIAAELELHSPLMELDALKKMGGGDFRKNNRRLKDLGIAVIPDKKPFKKTLWYYGGAATTEIHRRNTERWLISQIKIFENQCHGVTANSLAWHQLQNSIQFLESAVKRLAR